MTLIEIDRLKSSHAQADKIARKAINWNIGKVVPGAYKGKERPTLISA